MEFTTTHGHGIGRYGSVGLPDVTFSDTDRIEPISELVLLAGGTFHASHAVDLYILPVPRDWHRCRSSP